MSVYVILAEFSDHSGEAQVVGYLNSKQEAEDFVVFMNEQQPIRKFRCEKAPYMVWRPRDFSEEGKHDHN